MNAALGGMFVRPGMNLYKIADLTSIWVDVEIFEHQVDSMRGGTASPGGVAVSPGASVCRFGALPVPALQRADPHDDGVD